MTGRGMLTPPLRAPAWCRHGACPRRQGCPVPAGASVFIGSAATRAMRLGKHRQVLDNALGTVATAAAARGLRMGTTSE